jgi:hypothetical protein
MFIESRSSTFDLTLDGTSGTPAVTVPDLVNGNVVEVIASFMGSSNSAGFYYSVRPTDGSLAETLNAPNGVYQLPGGTGWASCFVRGYFKITGATVDNPVISVTFETYFAANDLGGSGRLNSFNITAQVVNTLEP